jgi:hypothetical protein
MAETIVIATFEIDSEAARKTILETKQELFTLQKQQAELRKEINKTGEATDEQTQTFIEQDQKIKKLTQTYNQQVTSLDAYTLAELKVSKALTETAKSEAQATAQNKELLNTRRQLDTTSKDYAESLKLINDKMDANNKVIADGSNAQQKAAAITGNYRQALFGVDAALSQFGINGQQARNVVKGFGDGVQASVEGFTNMTSSLASATKGMIGFKTQSMLATESQAIQVGVTEASAVANESLATSQVGVASATKLATTSTLTFAGALAATGIGAIILLISVAVGALVSYLSKLDPVMDKIEQITAGVAAAFSALGKAIATLNFKNLIGGMKDAADAASNLKAQQQELQDLQSSQEVANAKSSQQYDELILKSKNRTLTEKERVTFLKQAQAIEEANFKQRTALSNAELKQAIEAARIKGNLSKQELDNLNRNTVAYANYLLNAGKITQKEYDSIKAAELGKIAIKAESTRRLEKNQNAQDKLEDDAAAKREKRIADQKTASEKANTEAEKIAKEQHDRQVKALSDSLIVFETEKHTVEEQLLFYEKYYSDLNKLQGSDNKIANAQALSSKLLTIAQEQIKGELDAQQQALDAKTSITEEEQANQLANAELLKNLETNRVNASVLNEADKAKALLEINNGYNEDVKLINKNFDDSEKLRLEEQRNLSALDFELKKITIEEQGAEEFEIKRALLLAQFEEENRLLAEQLASREVSQAEYEKRVTINKKQNAKAKTDIDKQEAKLQEDLYKGLAEGAIQMASDLFGESKALSIASALINTYQGISAGVKLGYPMAIPAVAFAAATGFAAVKNILKTKKGDSGGGSSGTPTAPTGTAVTGEQPTTSIAKIGVIPAQDKTPVQPPVLILESLQEVQGQQQVKIKSV